LKSIELIKLTRSITCVFVGAIGGDARRVISGSNMDFLFDRLSSGVFSLIIATLDEIKTCFLGTTTGSIDGVCCSASS